MQEEEKFHRIIREKLEDFNPKYSPDDWKDMRRKILINNLLRFSLPSISLLVLGLGFYWFATDDPLPQDKIVTLKKEPTIPITPKQEEPKNDKTFTNVETPKFKTILPVVPVQSVLPEVVNDATVVKEYPLSELKVSKLATRNMAFPTESHNSLAEKEVRFLASAAVAMSDKISRVRQLGKTYELTSYQALDRNIEKWKNIVIVCDMTTNMFPYTTQVFDWIIENNENTTIKGIVFFTDCDSLGKQAKGRMPAKMFMVKTKDELVLWDTMFAAINNTENNKDRPENNIEALMFAQKNFPEADEIVMIADNSSSVKDMKQLSKVKKKTHIILCGETYEKNLAFQSDYIQIAKKTKGSIHTLEDDIENVSKIKDMSVVRVGNIYFRFQKGKFLTTKFLSRP